MPGARSKRCRQARPLQGGTRLEERERPGDGDAHQCRNPGRSRRAALGSSLQGRHRPRDWLAETWDCLVLDIFTLMLNLGGVFRTQRVNGVAIGLYLKACVIHWRRFGVAVAADGLPCPPDSLGKDVLLFWMARFSFPAIISAKVRFSEIVWIDEHCIG